MYWQEADTDGPLTDQCGAQKQLPKYMTVQDGRGDILVYTVGGSGDVPSVRVTTQTRLMLIDGIITMVAPSFFFGNPVFA